MKAETAQREGNCLHLSRINCQQPRIRDLDKKIGSSHSLIVGLQLLIEPCRSDEKYRLGWQSKTASSPHFAFIPSASRGTIFWRPWKLAKGNVANGGLLWENIPKMVEKTTQKLRRGIGSATLQECHLNDWMLDILFWHFCEMCAPSVPIFQNNFGLLI